MHFDVGLFDRLFGRKVEIEIPVPDGTITKVKATEKWIEKTQREGKLTKVDSIVHVRLLDALSGLSEVNWVVGEHIDQEIVDAFLDKNTNCLYAMCVYRNGNHETKVVQKELWDEAVKQLNELG